MKSTHTTSLYLVALAHFTLELCANFLPIVYPLLIISMGLTYAQIGLIALVAGTGMTLFQPVFGYLSDRWNPYWLTLLSILWIGLFMGLSGFAWNYWILLIIVGIGSLGSAGFHPAGATLAAAGSGSKKGAALSIFSVGGNLGSALSPLLVTVGMAWLGLHGTWLLIPVSFLLTLFLYRQWFLKSSAAKNFSAIRKLSTSMAPTTTFNGSVLGLMFVTLIVMSRSWFQMSLVTYLPGWMQDQGWSLTVSGQILAIHLLLISVGSLSGGLLSDKIGRWQVVLLSQGLLMPAYWAFLNTSGITQIAFVGIIGILLGASFPVTIVMAQESWPKGVGVASALVLGLGWLPGGIGASVTGYIADQSSLDTALQSLFLAIILGIIFTIMYAALPHQITGQQAVTETL